MRQNSLLLDNLLMVCHMVVLNYGLPLRGGKNKEQEFPAHMSILDVTFCRPSRDGAI